MREYLRKLREEKGLTIRAAADAVGVSKSYYGMIEAGQRQGKMDITLASKIAGLFGVTLDYIMSAESVIAASAPAKPSDTTDEVTA